MKVGPVQFVDALVVGAGPVGATTATLLRKAGASVMLVEKRASTAPGRFTMPVCDARTRSVLQSIGAGHMFVPAIKKTGIATSRMEQRVRELATKRGVDLRFGTEAGAPRPLPVGSEGSLIALTSNGTPAGEVRARLVIDATGGRWKHSPLGADNLRTLPERTHFAVGHWPHQPHLPPLWDLPVPGTRKGIFGPNSPIDGAAGAMEISLRRVDAAEQARLLDPATQLEAYAANGHAAGLRGDPDAVSVFELRQALASRAATPVATVALSEATDAAHAGATRLAPMIAVGDSLGRVNFKTADGLNAGFRDAMRAEQLWRRLATAGPAGRSEKIAALARFERESLEDHTLSLARGRQRFYARNEIPPPLEDFPELLTAERRLLTEVQPAHVVSDEIPARSAA